MNSYKDRISRHDHCSFPPVEEADEDGFLAYGGKLDPETLICAYESGIFPWFSEGQPVLWWSPPKRMVLFPASYKARKSLMQSLKKKGLEFKTDSAFEQVIRLCASVERKDQEGTWITDDMQAAYINLHRLGFAHSFETWLHGELVGGLYGLSMGSAFFGESMFSLVRDASKMAFHKLVEFCRKHDFSFIDCQLYTPHLASLGACEISRAVFMKELKQALLHQDLSGTWKLQ